MNDVSYGSAAEETRVFSANMRRMTAAYRLRLAERAEAIDAEPPTWEGGTISIDERKETLLAEDRHRIAPIPYPGLRSFDPGEGEIFFGRDRDIEAVRSLLRRDHVVAVLGGSGSGKSSLLRAGLLPFLNTKRRIEGRFGNWYRTEFRPRTKPLDELASALAEQLMLPLLRMSESKPRAAGPGARFLVRRRVRCRRRGGVASTGALPAGSPTRGRSAGKPCSTPSPTSPGTELDRADNIVTGGSPSRRAQPVPARRPVRGSVPARGRPDEREALLNLIVDLHEAARTRRATCTSR